VQRHYEELPTPDGFVAIGDALCTFNPIYARGMSAAPRQAKLLGETLSEHLSRARESEGISSDFYSRAAT
jgi:flavin-dependent dehydrogenase